MTPIGALSSPAAMALRMRAQNASSAFVRCEWIFSSLLIGAPAQTARLTAGQNEQGRAADWPGNGRQYRPRQECSQGAGRTNSQQYNSKNRRSHNAGERINCIAKALHDFSAPTTSK